MRSSSSEYTCGECGNYRPQPCGNPQYGSCPKWIGTVWAGSPAKCESVGRHEWVPGGKYGR